MNTAYYFIKMDWFNIYGLAAIVVILIPNIFYAAFGGTKYQNQFNNKIILIFEQVGRYGCMLFMVFNVPYTYFGFWFDNALFVYILIGAILLFLYCLGWVVFSKRNNLKRAIWLSVTPTVLFAFCGIAIASIPLILFSIIFGICHITISCKTCA